MKEGYQVAIPVIVCVGLAVLISFGIIGFWTNKNAEANKIVLDEGIITDLKIQNDGGFGSSTLYLIELDGKDYETTEDKYNLLSIGDHIRIYKGGKIEVLEDG